MCFGGGSKPVEDPAPAPALPQANPVQQEIGGARKDENQSLFGSAKGPKTVRSKNAGVDTSSLGPNAGLKL